MNHLRLLARERGRGRLGRWSKAPPKKAENCFEYGFDSKKRPLVIRQGIERQIYFVYNDDCAEAVKFTSSFLTAKETRGIEVMRQSTLNNIPIDCTWHSAHQRGFEKYGFKSEKLVSIDATWTNQPHKADDVLSAKYEASYDDSGVLVLLTCDYRAVGRHRGGSFTCYKK